MFSYVSVSLEKAKKKHAPSKTKHPLFLHVSVKDSQKNAREKSARAENVRANLEIPGKKHCDQRLVFARNPVIYDSAKKSMHPKKMTPTRLFFFHS